MFKNRVRTAALAGAIAVATGVSGLTVPAYADELAGNHHNQPDASLGAAGTELQNIPATARVKAADALRKAAEADRDAIDDHKFVDFNDPKYRPIEAESKAKADAEAAKATALLNQSTATLNDIRATLKAVQADTDAANSAWEKYADAVTINEAEQKKLMKLVEDLEKDLGANQSPEVQALFAEIRNADAEKGNKKQNGPIQNVAPGDEWFADQVLLDNKYPSNTATIKYVQDLKSHINVAMKLLNPDAEKDIDQINAVQQIAAQVNASLPGASNAVALLADAEQKTGVATQRNLATIKTAYARAQANVRAARTLQAYYLFASRWFDLYENDALRNNEDAGNSTVRAEYEEILFGAKGLGTRWNLAEHAEKSVDASIFWAPTGLNIDNDLSWESGVQRVRQIDKRYKEDAAAQAAADAAKDAQAKDLNASIAKIADQLEELNKAKAAGNNNQGNGGNTNTTPSTDDTKDSSSTWFIVDGKLQPAGIAAIVLGVVAALGGIVAFAFPQIQTFLKF